MPRLLLVEGFRFSFYANERQEPPHVHVRWLQPVRVAYSHGFSPPELRRLRELTFEHQVLFIERWYEYFGR